MPDETEAPKTRQTLKIERTENFVSTYANSAILKPARGT